jgi:hypothetical protein
MDSRDGKIQTGNGQEKTRRKSLDGHLKEINGHKR